MSRYFLTSLKIEGFRGINNEGDPLAIKFKKDKINSIFAVNGVGKSSVFDAVHYAITGKLPRLDELHQIERSEDYYLNRFHSQTQGTIELTFESDDSTPQTHRIVVERHSTGRRNVTSPTGHADPELLLSTFNSSFALLDYHTFNTFIGNSPLERGRSFSTLLGLDTYSDFRQTLRTVIDTRALRSDLNLPAIEVQARAQSDAAAAALVKVGNSYKSITGKDFSDANKLNEYSEEALNSLKQVELLKLELEPVASLNDVSFDAIIKIIKAAEGGKDKDRHLMLTSMLTKLNALGEPDESIASERGVLAAKVDELAKLYEATAGKQRRGLYDAADHLLASGGWHNELTCPLCENDLSEPIQAIVSNQQAQYKQVDEKIKEIKTYWLNSKLRARCALLEDPIGKDVPETERHFRSNDISISSGTTKTEELEKLFIYYDKIEDRLNVAKEKFAVERTELEKKLPKSLVQLTEQVEYVRQFRDNAKEFKTNTQSYATTKKNLDLRNRWQVFISGAADKYAQAEAELSRQKLLTIEAEYKAMFADVMGASDVVPNLTRDNTSEHLYVQLAEFRGQQDLSAKPLLSESFRNALAISVYLSAAMKHGDAPRFIILDDISSSFDAGHELKLMEYIRTKLQFGANINGLQFIILTHDELMQNLFERLSSSNEASHQIIEGMPPYNLTMRNKSTAQLRANAVTPLSAGQMEAGKPWVRPYLECKLMEVIRAVKITVPLDFAVKDRNRMIQNCLNAIQKDVDLHVAAGNIVLTQSQINDMKHTHLPSLLANWVTHFETGNGNGVSPAVLLSVIDSVDKFTECFKYVYTDPVSNQSSSKYYRSLTSQ